MHFRSVLSGTLALLLVSSVAALAAGTGASGNEQQPSKGGFSFHLPTLGIFGEKKKPDQVQFAQDGTGTTALQEQLRQMNGKIEELNFQVLQMQEQIRKQQEDNEFRFQQLEGGSQGAPQPAEQKKSDATTNTDSSVAEAPATHAPADAGTPPAGAQGEDVIVESPTGEPGRVIPGTPPKTFGTITVDKNGNVVDADGNTQAHAPAQNTAPATNDQAGTQAGKSDNTVVAALPATDDPEELYRNSYQFILSGDYSTAEQGFRDHIARFPKDAKAADAHYWLGESLLGQQKYRDAAETFLAASKDYPKAKKAPDMLLKLGVSLVGLNQRDVACATFGEIGKRYPNVSGTLKERVKQERALAAC
ncbi:MAG: tol-pal system protein YbgF [Mesorhizobium sp.]|uniref:Cell division coordinator CpoB n=1 Tax=Mesorhizobium mediterraneum TaxID=43617 RepID=A0AB36R4A4_9HYPH|nr:MULTISPECIES: tol-pal system protein YbgF [Mesorhizobium]PAP99595.1 tol-pal system protein YbgF [Mesorhizobium mediterraneum]RUU33093.1 tol-pal system protein YbgF [Mesorhizobium sp. M6A.T.Ce.TU.002.03.1.1]RWN36023.1 MAG: tol-pal system protein YbgF [Mesorhizobium sp.]RWN41530.1 MAG: tol-pal system protein YbgF [Mesorhizobium sp.]RWP00306.1 MAG: tol-pal system protein YbgF [Mesorhizobium sp.]